MLQSLVKPASTAFLFGQRLWQLLLVAAALQAQPDAECISSNAATAKLVLSSSCS